MNGTLELNTLTAVSPKEKRRQPAKNVGRIFRPSTKLSNRLYLLRLFSQDTLERGREAKSFSSFWKDNPVCIGGLTLAEKAKEKNLLKS